MDTDGMFEIGDEAIVLRSPGQMAVRWRWDELDDVRFRTWSGRYQPYQLTEILLFHGGATMRIPPSWLVANQADAARLMRRLEPAMNRKLDAWGSGTAVVPVSPETVGTFWFGFALLVALLLVALFTHEPNGLVGLLLVPVLLPLLRAIRTGGLIVGPHFLGSGPKELRFRDLPTITVQRVGRAEGWWLEAAGRRVVLSNGFDVPLLFRHVLRRCPSATFRYKVRERRDPIQRLLYPIPPGAPPEWFTP